MSDERGALSGSRARPGTPGGTWAAWRLLALGVAAASAFTLAGTGPGSLDDVFITLVYARNLAESGDFFWNAADGRIDGFTSLLDVLVKAPLFLAFRDPVAAAWWLNLACHISVPLLAMAACAWTLGGAAGAARRGAATAAAATAATAVGLALATSRPLAYASAFLLEMALFAALAVAAVAGAVRPARPGVGAQLGFVLVLAVLTLARPEGLFLAAALVGLQGLRLAGADVPRSVRAAPAAAFLGFAAAYLSGRVLFFGHWAPNTYYAKTSASRLHELRDGLGYLAAYAATPDGLVLLAGLGLLLLWLAARARRRAALPAAIAFPALGAALMTGGVVVSGGDCYAGARFLVPTVALATLAFGAAAASRERPAAWLGRASLAALLVIQLGVELPHARAKLQIMARDWPLTEEHFDCHRRIAEALASMEPAPVVAETDYQIVKYFAPELTVIDLQGLSDRAIAHRPVAEPVRFGKFGWSTALERDPDVWIYGYRVAYPGCPALAGTSPLRALTDPALYEPCFGYGAPPEQAEVVAARYRLATLRVCELNANLLVRRGLEARARAAGFRVEDGPARP